VSSLAETAKVVDEKRPMDWLSSLVGKPVFWIVFVVIIATVPMVRTIMIRLPPPLPVIATVPDFQLINESGTPFGSKDLRGKVWIADFIFTRCPTACPLITQRMQKVQHRVHNMGSAIHLVSFSADPEYDTPARLHEYAEHHRASPRLWSFLTGPVEDVKTAVVNGLKVSQGREGSGDDVAGIFHDNHFVVVDPQMQIRGYYDSSSDEAVERLIRDVGLIANRGG
jgi:protein SCO1/2